MALMPSMILSEAINDATLKAVFIERFTRFIEWPNKTQEKDSSKDFFISVIGDEKFSTLLKSIYKDKKIKNRNVHVINELRFNGKNQSQVVFISQQSISQLTSILERTRNTPILTIGDTAGMAEKGIHINFFPSPHRMHFEINPTAIQKSGLQISFKLLSQAIIVDTTQ